MRASPWLALLVAGAAAAPASAFEIAVQDDGVFVEKAFDRERALRQARAVGATYIRVDLPYAAVAARGLRPYDDLVAAARRHGLRLQMVLYGTPRFTHGSRRINYYRPHVGRFATFTAYVARHFRGRVRRYSIWNEPNLAHFLSPPAQAPRIYRALYLAGYRSIKAVDPANQVLLGELGSQKRVFSWVRSMGRGLRADGFAYHPYQFYRAPWQRDTRFFGISNTPAIMRGVRDLARDGYVRTPRGLTPPVYFTEFSYPVGRPYPTAEAVRARWIPFAFALARRHGVRQLGYYKLQLRPFGSNWNSGLVRVDGTPTSSFLALQRARASLVGR